jgi:hypothetical protein
MGRRLKYATLPRGPELFNKFLVAYVECANVKKAAAAVGVHRVTLYRWKWSIPEFAVGWLEADELISEAAFEELTERAIGGVERLVSAQERLLDRLRERSDAALIALCKLHDRRTAGEHPKF